MLAATGIEKKEEEKTLNVIHIPELLDCFVDRPWKSVHSSFDNFNNHVAIIKICILAFSNVTNPHNDHSNPESEENADPDKNTSNTVIPVHCACSTVYSNTIAV